MKIISITGTKGKTTITRMLDVALRALNYETLRVDTDGHYVNGRQKSNYYDSKNIWGIVPNVCPGRYLFEVKKMDMENTVAVLESAIGSSSLTGMGYSRHDIGLFTNIFDDHITKNRIKSRDDIYLAKRFIFERLKDTGTLVINADDEFLMKNFEKETINNKILAIGQSLKPFETADFFEKGNTYLHIHHNKFTFYFNSATNEKQQIVIENLQTYPITCKGKFTPNIYNLAFVFAALFILLGTENFINQQQVVERTLKSYRPSKTGGRLVFLKDRKKKITILIDFAHEKESLKQVALLARQLTKKRIIGVLRIDPSRINEDIETTAAYIADAYDQMYIYDKIDGVKATESWLKAEGKKRGVGETAAIFAKGLSAHGYERYEVILQESQALGKAYDQAKAGDIIIYIGEGDNHLETYTQAKKLIS